MSISHARLAGERAIAETIRTHWALFLIQGVIMAVLGVLAVISPQILTLAVDRFVGWMFLISGLIGFSFLGKPDESGPANPNTGPTYLS